MELVALIEAIARACHACGRDPASVKLVAVSKGRSVEEILALYSQGQRDFGESRLQEVEAKRPHLPRDIRWHMIGTVQRKKAPKIVGRFYLIHSVDSLELAQKIAETGVRQRVVTHVLLQVNTSGEATKHGFTPEMLIEQFSTIRRLPNIAIHGLMTMAQEGAPPDTIRHSFSSLKSLQQKLAPDLLVELSMGMSQDYVLAIEEGATLLRIGSLLFA